MFEPTEITIDGSFTEWCYEALESGRWIIVGVFEKSREVKPGVYIGSEAELPRTKQA